MPWLFFRDNDLMATLTVYGDASGAQPDKEIAVVGGIISTVEQWAHFNQEWGNKVLAKAGVEVYHASDLEGGYAKFKGWKRKPGKIEKFQALAYKTLKSR